MWRVRRDREVVNLPDDAVLTRHDQVEAKCALMVERNPGVIVSAAWERRKRRDATRRELKELSASCDENVARGEPGIRRLRWSYSHVFFSAASPRRELSQNRDIPEAVDPIDLLAAVFARDQFSLRSGHAYGRVDNGKGTWIGGVKDSCHRYQPRRYDNDFCSEGDFFHILNSRLRRDSFYFTN